MSEAMTNDELILHLQSHVNAPQKSERWAMYRLIVPVVDFANATLGMCTYFEFNQTSTHGTSQAVDVALIDDHGPRVMIEAKRVDRRIAAEQIEKYLEPGIRGVVTNGINWVLCHEGKSKVLSLRRPHDGLVAVDALNEVVAFIRGNMLAEVEWSSGQIYVEPTVRPEKPGKLSRARRVSNSVQCARTVDALRTEIQILSRATPLERALLEAMVATFERGGGIPPHLRCEVRSSRVSFYDERVTTGSTRVSRLELGKTHPDVLVLTELAGPETAMRQIASASPHDKGPHMRRFRLNGDVQTRRFGEALADMLSRCEVGSRIAV